MNTSNTCIQPVLLILIKKLQICYAQKTRFMLSASECFAQWKLLPSLCLSCCVSVNGTCAELGII